MKMIHGPMIPLRKVSGRKGRLVDSRVAGGLTHSLAQVRAYGVGTPDHGLNTYSLIRSPDEARRPRLVMAFPLRI